ncbi:MULTISPECIES: hypothetical protein [Moorena]|nr:MULTISPECIES: hypothetical protein [Moorena]NEO81794.1 hypothetical protein [Moorena sp. SIO4G3]
MTVGHATRTHLIKISPISPHSRLPTPDSRLPIPDSRLPISLKKNRSSLG